jgi:hypothetical protein
MCQRDLLDEARRRLNEKTAARATRRRVAWTPQEDEVILNEWVLVDPEDRQEFDIAIRLSRTLFACQGRAEHLRGVLDFRPTYSTRTPEKARPVCQRCFLELPATGVCDNCD